MEGSRVPGVDVAPETWLHPLHTHTCPCMGQPGPTWGAGVETAEPEGRSVRTGRAGALLAASGAGLGLPPGRPSSPSCSGCCSHPVAVPGGPVGGRGPGISFLRTQGPEDSTWVPESSPAVSQPVSCSAEISPRLAELGPGPGPGGGGGIRGIRGRRQEGKRRFRGSRPGSSSLVPTIGGSLGGCGHRGRPPSGTARAPPRRPGPPTHWMVHLSRSRAWPSRRTLALMYLRSLLTLGRRAKGDTMP